MFFNYYAKIIEEQQKNENATKIENPNTEKEKALKKAKKLAKKKQAEVFDDTDEKETSTESEEKETSTESEE